MESPFGPNFSRNIHSIREDFIFAIMPFEENLTKIYNNIIKKCVENKGFICNRADDIMSNHAIIYDIWKSICEARFIIADLTNKNPNVMYELGISHAVGKEIIILAQDGTELPFDTKHIRTIFYKDNRESECEFYAKISNTIEYILNKENSTMKHPARPHPYREPKVLQKPRSPSEIEKDYTEGNYRIAWGDLVFPEAALLFEAKAGIWRPNEMTWILIDEPFRARPEEFWAEIDEKYPVREPSDATDREAGKHIRLAGASERRSSDVGGVPLELVWQRMSWQDSGRTNGRILPNNNILRRGAPIRAWFDPDDMRVPPVPSGHVQRADNPLGNRLAINLAVILRDRNGDEFALFQRRDDRLDASPLKIECGISESVHGDRGWQSSHEFDVVDGTPRLDRTAMRCLWQEIGFAQHGKFGDDVPTFNIDIAFTALILTREEMYARLLGYLELQAPNRAEEGVLAYAKRASELSRSLQHPNFQSRKQASDNREWRELYFLPATREGLAPVFRHPKKTTPECRARLLYWLKHKYPDTWNKIPDKEGEPPEWLTQTG